MTAHLVDGIGCAQVEVDATAVTLSFLGDLTPVEAVAAFLRDVADLCGIEADLLLDLADQLDAVTPDPPAVPMATAAAVETDAAIRLGGLALAFTETEPGYAKSSDGRFYAYEVTPSRMNHHHGYWVVKDAQGHFFAGDGRVAGLAVADGYVTAWADTLARNGGRNR